MTNYIGMDAHSKTCTFVVLDGEGKELATQKIPTGESEILRFVRSLPIDRYRELYAIEQEIRDCPAAERRAVRQAQSKPILDRMKEYLFELRALPKSSLGEAQAYALKYWQGLTRYLEDGRLPIDNNRSERGLRGPVLGRKNFYGNHSQRGAKTSAIFYSLIESCKLNGVEPYRYLKETLQLILNEKPFLTPAQYAAKNPK